jgi:hypothetical protein
MSDFLSLTTPTFTAPDTATWEVPDGWQQGRGAFGGLVLATLIRALVHDAPADRPLRTLTAALPAPTLVGSATLHRETLREGRGTTIRAVRLVQDGTVAVHAVGVLGVRRVEDGTWDRPVEVGDWREATEVPVQPPIGPVFAPHYEYRLLEGLPMSGRDRRTAGWIRPRLPGPVRDAAYLAGCADAWWPAAYVAMSRPRPAATVSFTLDVLGTFDGLDPDAPLHLSADADLAHEGFTAETRLLRGHDGRILARNVQTMVIVK